MEERGIGEDLLLDNFISTNNVLISKKMEVEERIVNFVVMFSSPSYLHHCPMHTTFFHLLNKFIIKSDHIPGEIAANLSAYLSKPLFPTFNFSVLPLTVHSLGHLFLASPELPIDEGFVEGVIELVVKK
jgi:hypothetical protein